MRHVHGYETKVKVFMLLVVLFLVTSNLVTVTFLNRSEALLLEEATARVLSATESMAREAASEEMAAPIRRGEPAAAARAGERLARLGTAMGASFTDLLDGEGRILASSQTWRTGAVEPLDRSLDPSDVRALQAGRSVIVPAGEEGSLTLGIVPIPSPAGGDRLLLRAGYVLAASATITRQIRLLTWTQAIGGIVVLILVLLFTRFVLRPYRDLRDTAAGLPAPSSASLDADDPAFLVESFRGVVDKMRSLEAELERARFGASSSGSQEILLSSLSSGVLILDASGGVAALNPAGERILGLAAREIAGRKAAALFADSPELSSILGEAVLSGKGRSREVVPHRLPGGRTVHLGVTVSGPPGGGAGALCLFSDLTEIRGLQARVLLKENLAKVGELSAGIAHEFRNGLATILGYARLAARQEGGEAGNAQSIVREVQSLGRLVDEFLRYAAPARLQRAPIDLRAALADVAREVVRDGEPATVTLTGEWPPLVAADETLLRQAFHNLMRNAVEASLEAGPGGEVRVAGRSESGSAVVEIVDAGAGFPEEVLGRLFTPFVTTKDRGTGLGMALAQKIVVSHDGSIEASNVEGGGARVTVTLPLA